MYKQQLDICTDMYKQQLDICTDINLPESLIRLVFQIILCDNFVPILIFLNA